MRRGTFALTLLCSAGFAGCAEDSTTGDDSLGVGSGDPTATNTSTMGNMPVAPPPASSTTANSPPAASPPASPPSIPPTPPASSPMPPMPMPPASSTAPDSTAPAPDNTAGAPADGGASGMGGAGGTPDDPGNAGEGGETSAPGGSGGEGGGTAGGAGGAGGSGGEATSGDFDPCPDEGPCAILPLGDSITEGIGSSNGSAYRGELFRLAINDGKDVTYVGTRQAGPMDIDGTPFPRLHEGTSGITVSGLDMKLGGLVDQIGEAHIILVHLGTNDMYTQPGPAMAPQRLGTFLDNVISYWPDALIVVAQLTPYPSQDDDIQTYNAAIVPIVQERIDAGAHMMMVDQHSTFPDNALADVVHPNDTGYAHMAEVWYEAIGPFLKP